MFKNVSIVGVGLLGGSVSLAIKKRRLAERVTGFFRDSRKATAALASGIVDEATTDFSTAVDGAELIVLASPVSDILARIKQLKCLVRPTCLVIDVGSTKREIVKAARGLNFVGAHPLAGSQEHGFRSADGDLFHKAVCVLTPVAWTQEAALRKTRLLWQRMGAKTIEMSPGEHDSALAMTSHLPHALAYALVSAMSLKQLALGAGSLRDMTRVALSLPELWTDIFLSNRVQMVHALDRFEHNLGLLKKYIQLGHRKDIHAFLKAAQAKRLHLSAAKT